MNVGNSEAGTVFEVLGEAPAAADPGETGLDDPAFGERPEAFGVIAALDDLDLPRAESAHGGAGLALIGGIGEDAREEGKRPTHGLEQQRAAIAILDVGWTDQDSHEQGWPDFLRLVITKARRELRKSFRRRL
jgi:hypothetical protein